MVYKIYYKYVCFDEARSLKGLSMCTFSLDFFNEWCDFDKFQGRDGTM